MYIGKLARGRKYDLKEAGSRSMRAFYCMPRHLDSILKAIAILIGC